MPTIKQLNHFSSFGLLIAVLLLAIITLLPSLGVTVA
jgi:hypothetical protein